jgi:hypothetical protein
LVRRHEPVENYKQKLRSSFVITSHRKISNKNQQKITLFFVDLYQCGFRNTKKI